MKYLRRFVWYLASRLMLACAILGLMTVAFYYAMNASNIQIVLKDGMAKRAQVIIMGEESSELTKFFQPGYLSMDADLQNAIAGNSAYRNYTVNGIDHRLEMEWMWAWPWEDTARADIIERVPKIDGRALSSKRDELVAAGGEENLNPPSWGGGYGAKYRAVLVRENGQWRVRSLTFNGFIN